MKKVIIFVAAVLLGSVSFSGAQDLRGMFNISPFAGLGLPMGELAENDAEQVVLDDGDGLYRAMGFKFGASAEYFFTPAIGVGLDFLYAIHGSKEIDVEGETFEADDKLHTMNIGAHIRYVFLPENMLRPYIVGGGGLTMNKIKDVPIEIEEDLTITERAELKLDTKLYFMGGVGALYWVSENISVFGEVGFDYLMIDGSGVEVDGEEIPDAEVTANYYLLDFKVGINIWFGGME